MKVTKGKLIRNLVVWFIDLPPSHETSTVKAFRPSTVLRGQAVGGPTEPLARCRFPRTLHVALQQR